MNEVEPEGVRQPEGVLADVYEHSILVTRRTNPIVAKVVIKLGIELGPLQGHLRLRDVPDALRQDRKHLDEFFAHLINL